MTSANGRHRQDRMQHSHTARSSIRQARRARRRRGLNRKGDREGTHDISVSARRADEALGHTGSHARAVRELAST